MQETSVSEIQEVAVRLSDSGNFFQVIVGNLKY